MKVLHVIDSGGLYGAEIMLLSLAEEQLKIGIDAVIASIGGKKIKEKAIEIEAEKRNIVIKKFRMFPGFNFVGALKIIKFAQKENFNIIHSHGYKGNILLGFIPKILRKIPIVSTIHGYTSTNQFSKMKLYETLDLLTHRFIDKVVLVNKGMLNNPNLRKHKGFYHIINNGIALNPENKEFIADQKGPLNKKIISFCKDKFVIGSIGRLSNEKGYDYLIDALEILLSKKVDASLIIIGEGYKRKYLEQKVQSKNLVDKVLFPGYIYDAQKYIKYFDIYSIPSLTEGLPITLLEAMQAKVPVVASEVGGIPEVINENCGILVPPCMPDLIAQACLKIYKDPDFALTISNNANAALKTHYSADSMARNYYKLYKTM